jgi:hypothetical protein
VSFSADPEYCLGKINWSIFENEILLLILALNIGVIFPNKGGQYPPGWHKFFFDHHEKPNRK